MRGVGRDALPTVGARGARADDPARPEGSDPAETAAPTRILRDVDLEVAPGTLLHVVGPSGSGKTSLLRLVNRLDERSAGELDVLGRPVEQWAPRELRRRAAMVFQAPSLLGRTVRENLRLPFELAGEDADEASERIDEALAAAGCERAWLDREAGRLSAGQVQRVTIARALVTSPDVLLLDEPTASLDPRTAGALLDELAALRSARGTTMIMVTHRVEEARRLGGRMVVLIDGRVAAEGEVGALLEDPPGESVRDVLRGASVHA